MSTQQNPALGSLEKLAHVLIRWNAMTLEVLLRRPGTFGELYFSIGHMVMGFITFKVINALYNVWMVLQGRIILSTGGWLLAFELLFSFSYLGMGIWHLVKMHRRARDGVRWYSMAQGQTWFGRLTELPPVKVGNALIRIDSEHAIMRYVEPLTIFVLAFIIMPYSLLRFWLLWSSVALLIHQNMTYSAVRRDYVNRVDQQIQDEAKKAGSSQLDGFRAIPVPDDALTRPIQVDERSDT